MKGLSFPHSPSLRNRLDAPEVVENAARNVEVVGTDRMIRDSPTRCQGFLGARRAAGAVLKERAHEAEADHRHGTAPAPHGGYLSMDRAFSACIV